MMRRTSSGVDLYSSEISMELMHTDLPEPVVPAISMCGILAMSPMTGLPVMSLPTAKDRRFRIRERRRADTLADKDGIDRLVRHLDADRDLIRDRRDTHIRRAERQRNVVRQGGDARDFDAARDGQLEPGDRRAADNADDLRLDVERIERIEQTRRAFAQLGFCARDRGVLACVSRSIGG